MDIARAFTTRRNKPQLNISSPFGRAASQRAGRPVVRGQISAPVALLSTSNDAQLKAAQDIRAGMGIATRDFSTNSATSSSSEESDTGTGSMHSRDASTDASSIDESPTSPEPNHLSCYFKSAGDAQTTSSPNESTAVSPLPTPQIPQRAPSHSKRAHEGVHRMRSMQRMLSPAPSQRRKVQSSSSDAFSPLVESPRQAHPFDDEFQQLDEVAEELGQVVHAVDTEYMAFRGLAKHAASEYMFEIQTLVHTLFDDERGLPAEVAFF